MVRFIAFILLIGFSSAVSGQDRHRLANLVGQWKFALGDNPDYASPSYNDQGWDEIFVPAFWQDEGFKNYNGFAWYRKSVKLEYNEGDILYLELGRIDDADEVYVNGKLIGSMGGFPPHYFSAYNYPRKYRIPAEVLKRNGLNVIAVRVYDRVARGGILGKTVGVFSEGNLSPMAFGLFGNWKFRLGDDKRWSATEVEEAGWEDILVPASWESQGFDGYDGFAWYRKNFKLPADYNTRELLLLLGKVDDLDEVFINGKKIGETGDVDGRSPNADEYARYRTYTIPDGLLKAGADNVIAVRVFDAVSNGGIYQGPITLLPRKEYRAFWKEYTRSFNWEQWWSYYFD